MRRLLILVLVSLFYSSFAWAACNTTVASDITSANIDCDNNDTYVVNEGVSITGTISEMVDVISHTGVTITNNGTIDSSKHRTINIQGGGDVTLTNNGTIEAASTAVHLRSHDGDISITNTGTINSTQHGTINNYAYGVSGDITIINSGTIKGEGGVHPATSHNPKWLGVIELEGCTSSSNGCSADTTGSYTITNSGTIEQEDSPFSAIKVGNHLGATITNTGTIVGGPEDLSRLSVLTTPQIGMDIVVMKCTTTSKYNNCGSPDSGNGDATTTIKIGDGAVFTNGIDLNGTKANFVIGSDIKRDYTIRIFDYVEEGSDNLTITNNSDGTTYSISAETLTFSNGTANVNGHIHESKYAGTHWLRQRSGQGDTGLNENAQYYNAGTDGVLTILGEKLEVEKNNQKFRAENTLTKIRGLFGAANYLGGQWPDNCTTIDPEKTNTELNETCNNRFVKLFHSYQKRDGVYDGTSSGIVGMLSPIEWKGYPIISNLFVGYSNQSGDFNNGEYLGGDNFVLGLKNTYEHKGFKASFTPMIGVNNLEVKDYDTDKIEIKATDFLSEFAALNGKINKKIGTGEDNYLNISVEGTFGLQKFPEYLSKFTDGDLSVDESIEQLLSGGFEVSYLEEIPGNFVIKPYMGVSLNRNLNNTINITARNKNADVSNDHQETWSGYHAGVSLTKQVKDMNFDLDLMYGNEDGLINQIAAISLTKSFRQSETTIPTTKSDKDIRIASAISDKDLLEFGDLKKISEFLKAKNEQLKIENEKLKMLSAKVIQENKASKQLIVELLKENEKIKLEKEIFKNKILENENKELLEEIEKGVTNDEVNRFALLLFITILILIAYGISSFAVSVVQASLGRNQ